MRIELEDALKFIRAHQTNVMDLGYYLTLAGGVLNKGYSDSDLDIVVIPRTATSNFEDLIHYFNNFLTLEHFTSNSRGRDLSIYHYTHETGFPIDLAIVQLSSQRRVENNEEVYKITTHRKLEQFKDY